MARYRIEDMPGVLETAEPDSGVTWNGWSVPRATPTEIGRYLYDRAWSMPREDWVECLFDFAAEYLVQVSDEGGHLEPVPPDQVRHVDGFSWVPAEPTRPHTLAPWVDCRMAWVCSDCDWIAMGSLTRREAREVHDRTVGA